MKRLLSTFVLCLASLLWLGAQPSLFVPTADRDVPAFVAAENDIPVSTYSRLSLNYPELLRQLANAPLEGTTGRSAVNIQVPAPGGQLLTFRVEDSPVMHPGLAARYPDIKSYRAHSEWGVGRIAVSPRGFSAALMGPDGEYFISPAVLESNVHHLMYFNRDIDLNLLETAPPALACGYDAAQVEAQFPDDVQRPAANGSGRSSQMLISMYQYDLALTCTGEFANLYGGTLSGVMSAFNEAVTLLNAILEREMASRFMLIEDNDLLIFLDPGSDPYNNSNNGGMLLSQIEPAIVGIAGIPLATFDLGHLFTAGCTDVGGVVSGRACSPGKTRGVTCNSSQNIPGVVRRIMSHEIAHQFAVGHSWNNCPPSEEQRASSSAFEPGSGTTIMSYAGTCGNQNVANNNDDYYHVGSVDQFLEYSRVITGESCPTILTPTNNAPEITLDYTNGFYIPISTPFQLTGSATDADGDELQYNWEQYDLGPADDLGDPSLNSPLFRSYPPSTEGATRVLPRLNRVINNTSSVVEVLPTYSRDLTFRISVRDNNPAAGAVVWETVAFRSAEEAGPFLVTFPNDGTETFTGGEYVEITWDVANTDQAPVNCQLVNVRLSLDGGLTYPVTLLENAGNTGSAFVTIPADVTAGNARVRVDAADNIFFDISNASFPINAPTEPGFTLEGPQFFPDVCLPTTISASFTAGSFLGFNETIDLAVESDMLPDGVVATLSQSSVNPGESSTLTVDLTESDFDGNLDVTISATVNGGEPVFRTVTLDVVNNDYSDLQLNTPAEGAEGIQLAAPFDWTDAQYADLYDIQVATSPDFAEENLFDQAYGIPSTEFTQDSFFLPNTVYFWRVRGENECGPGPWADPRSFQTINVDCADFASTDTPVTLPGSGGTASRESELFIDVSGTISDVNIPNIFINYSGVSNISIYLTSPAGTEVALYEEDCNGFTNLFNSGFDDDAPAMLTCPPDDGIVFLPKEPLSSFTGENTFGTWTLRVDISSTNQPPGNIASWNIEFCASLDTEDPFLVFNELDECNPNSSTTVSGNELRAQDNNFGPTNVMYTLVREPLHGFLRLNGTDIAAGAEFSQQSIYNNHLRYFNTNPDVVMDDFSFVVQNPNGGYIPVNYHNIQINGPTSVDNPVERLNEPIVFPNPVAGHLQLRWAVSTESAQELMLLDVAGKLIRQERLPAFLTNHQIDMSALPAGIYFLRVGTAVHRVVKR